MGFLNSKAKDNPNVGDIDFSHWEIENDSKMLILIPDHFSISQRKNLVKTVKKCFQNDPNILLFPVSSGSLLLVDGETGQISSLFDRKRASGNVQGSVASIDAKKFKFKKTDALVFQSETGLSRIQIQCILSVIREWASPTQVRHGIPFSGVV